MTRSAVFACLLAVIAGCSAGKTDMEKSVKQEMKTALNVEITAVSLTKQSDGGYSGTATAANGDTYDVTATAPSSDGRFEWKAVVTQSTVERMLRDHLKTTMTIEVSALDLKKQPDGGYTGTANAANGDTYEVTAGARERGDRSGCGSGPVDGRADGERGHREADEGEDQVVRADAQGAGHVHRHGDAGERRGAGHHDEAGRPEPDLDVPPAAPALTRVAGLPSYGVLKSFPNGGRIESANRV